jgi:hypothetical protein
MTSGRRPSRVTTPLPPKCGANEAGDSRYDWDTPTPLIPETPMKNVHAAGGSALPEQRLVLLMHRLVAAQVAEIAVLLAQQAGEEVQRPLSEAQLLRGLEAFETEVERVHKMLFEPLDE